jgi:hypothetical protein
VLEALTSEGFLHRSHERYVHVNRGGRGRCGP